MFHLLFVPRYLDYVQTDLGRGYLGLSPSCLERLFHFCLSTSPPSAFSLSLSPSNPPPIPFFLRHSLVTYLVASYHRPKSLFSLSFRPSIPPSSILLSFLSLAFLCSAVTLSSLLHVLLEAYSVLDVEFYCHSVYTGTL